jgi:hypothetical protein
MTGRRKIDCAVIGLAIAGLSAMAASRIAGTIRVPGSLANSGVGTILRSVDWLGVGIGITLLAIVGAIQVKLIEFFFAGIHWVNRRDDPRFTKRPPDPP